MQLPRNVVADAHRDGVSPAPAAVDRWLVGAGRRHLSVRSYLAFVERAYEQVRTTRRYFDASNPNATGSDDAAAAYIGRYELLHLVNLIYLSADAGIDGSILECGTFHGCSTASLSWVCALLDRELLAADSFEGLPDVGQGDGQYRAGAFSAGLEAAQRNVSAFGEPAAVRFVKGWYAQSLRDLEGPFAMIWLDVDLYESAIDALGHVLPRLAPGGLICFHETRPRDFDDDGQLNRDDLTPGGVRKALDSAGVRYEGRHLAGYTGAVRLLAEDGTSPSGDAFYDPNRFERLLFALRPAERARAALREVAASAVAVAPPTAVQWAIRRGLAPASVRWAHHNPRLRPR